MEPILRIANLAVGFGSPVAPLWAVRGIDLEVCKGEILGLVGESGSGKSVTFLAALGLLGGRASRKGSVRFEGLDLLELGDRELTALRGRRIAMIFQDPMSSLNPVQTVGKQLVEAITLHRGLAGQAARGEARRLLERVGLSDPDERMRNYPHQLSGGMNQRVMIAMAIAGKPDLIIADEPTTALDVTIQAQILDLLVELVREEGASMVLITHDLGVVAETCDRVAVMYAGRVVEVGPVERIFARAEHPYTRGLLHCIPTLESDVPLRPIEGSVPDAAEIGGGCAFATRCDMVHDHCRSTSPSFLEIGAGHGAACFRVSA
ncbi:MAG TPA: ABC transporter ATP-binding protein [Pseudaminobacter sp.]|jgi:peptide/nickel transport system ATP-binding protein|nr:ABC transporter ATP-binding protein [Pseudaminobacter sp.]